MSATDHRMGRLAVTVRDTSGTPVPGIDVSIEQTGHAFGFGNIGFDLIPFANGEHQASAGHFGGATRTDGEYLASRWLEIFNLATLPFYWASFEPVEGQPRTQVLQRTAEWFVDHGVTVKGHPLLWHTLAPRWLGDRSLREAEETMRARITREVSQFAGLVDLWDALNEPVILPVFTAQINPVTRLAQATNRMHVIRLAFETAREANPNARLVLNDFDLSEDYEHVIEECLDAGIQVDALGIQTHMHQGFRGEDEIHEILERFARFELPLQLTETTLVSGELMPADIVDLNDYQVDSWPSTPAGEDRQADELVRHYRTVVAHPLVESLTYWGLTDDGAWLGAPAGLLRADGSPKPAFDALKALVREEWWLARTTLPTEDDGVVSIEGFAGTYHVQVEDTALNVTLPAGQRKHDVEITVPVSK